MDQKERLDKIAVFEEQLATITAECLHLKRKHDLLVADYDDCQEKAKKEVEYSFNEELYKKIGLNYLQNLCNSFYSEPCFWTNAGVVNEKMRQESRDAGHYVRTVLIPAHNLKIENIKFLVKDSFNKDLYVKDGSGYLKFLSNSFFSQETFSGKIDADKKQQFVAAGNYIRDILISIHNKENKNSQFPASKKVETELYD